MDSDSESVVDVEEKPRKPGKFMKGDPRIFNARATAAGKSERENVKVEVEGVGLLRAMRHVLRNSKAYDTTSEEQACRKWFDDDPKGFLLKSHDLEVAELDRTEKGKKADSNMGPDLGHDEACRVLDRLLKEAAKP